MPHTTQTHKKRSFRPLYFSAILVLIWTLTSSCQTTKYDRAEAYLRREQLHNYVWEKVNNLYFDPTFNGINWANAGYDGKVAVMKAKTLDEAYDSLIEMVGKIKNGHTYILSPEQYTELKKNEFIGVGFSGVRHSKQKDLDIVFSVIKGSPADKAGIKPGWIFLNEKEMNLSSREIGTTGTYRFLDQYGIVHEKQLVCIELPKISNDWESKLLKSNILLLRFDNFNEKLEFWIHDELKKHPEAKGVILDVRWNPGGYKHILERVLSLFLPNRSIIGTTITRLEHEKILYSPTLAQKRISELPLAVLISPFSASSAEILASVLQHYERATVIGSGNSAGEVIFSLSWDLEGGGLLRVGMRDYLNPTGQRLEGNGVTPDVQLEEQSFFEITRGHDPILEKAIDVLNKKTQKRD